MTGAEPFILGMTFAETAVVAGAAFTATSQIQAGQAAKAQGKAQKKIAEFNALQKEREAKSRMKAAELEEERLSKRQKRFQAEQRAAIDKSGVSGSPLALLAETAGAFQIDRALTLRQGLIESNFLKSQAGILRAGGQVALTAGKTKANASFMQAGVTILSAAGSFGKTPAEKYLLLAKKHGIY